MNIFVSNREYVYILMTLCLFSLVNIKNLLFLPLLIISLNKNKEKMKKIRMCIIWLNLVLFFASASSQNTSEVIIGGKEGLHIGGYGQIDYNK